MSLATHFRELRVYRLAFDAAMELFAASKEWPREERYSLVDQVRRSSRSVCANIAEAWTKRRYPGHFASKLCDAEGEASETQNWLDFALACGYLDEHRHAALSETYAQIARGLAGMISHADSWCAPVMRVREPAESYTFDGVVRPQDEQPQET